MAERGDIVSGQILIVQIAGERLSGGAGEKINYGQSTGHDIIGNDRRDACPTGLGIGKFQEEKQKLCQLSISNPHFLASKR